MAGDEGAGSQLKDQAAIHLGVEGEIKVVEGSEGIPKFGLFASAFEQAVGPPGEFIGDQTGDQVQGGHGFGLSLTQACFEHRRHPTQT